MNAPLGSMGELCVALAHRWEPQRRFVIFTAYFDESDTHGPSPTVILAAFLGHAYQWRRFEAKLARLQKQHCFRIFHAKDFMARQREFAGWTDEQCSELIRDLTVLVKENLTEGLAIYLERERYEREYRAEPFPRKMHKDSQYGVCFRGSLGRLLQVMEARSYRDRLHVVMENGHQNVGDCERIFFDIKKRWARMGAPVLGDFTIKSKEDCPPLMVADMLAYAFSMLRKQIAEGEMTPEGLPPAAPDSKGRLAFIELDKGALEGLKLNYERLRQLEAEQWRAERAARRASALAGPQS